LRYLGLAPQAKSRKADGNKQLPADTQPKLRPPKPKKPDATAGLLQADHLDQYITTTVNQSFNGINPTSPDGISAIKNHQNQPLFR
jgi:hypothetical protein